MNPLRRTLLNVFRYPAMFMNESLGKRSGMLGRIGRFLAIGGRDYGVHPSTKFLKMTNYVYLYFIRHFFTRNRFSRTYFGKQNTVGGYGAAIRLYNHFLGFMFLYFPFVVLNFGEYTRKVFILFGLMFIIGCYGLY
jgi:hypothetical protein